MSTAIRKKGSNRLVATTVLALCANGLSSNLLAITDDQTSSTCNIDTAINKFENGKVTACLTDKQLSELRGGFFSSEGIVVSFGFERVVSVNGDIQEHITASLPVLNIGNNVQIVPVYRALDLDYSINQDESLVQWASDAQSTITAANPDVQIVDNTKEFNDLMTNVIQNQLDDTIIEQLRVVNIELKGLGSSPEFDPQHQLIPTIIEHIGR